MRKRKIKNEKKENKIMRKRKIKKREKRKLKYEKKENKEIKKRLGKRNKHVKFLELKYKSDKDKNSIEN